MEEQEAHRRGVPREAWLGNAKADEYAAEAAAGHELPEVQRSCYEWVRATGALVRGRLIQATLDAFKERSSMTHTEKELQRAARQPQQRRQRDDIPGLRARTTHSLEQHGLRWRCTRCGQSGSLKQRPALRAWLQAPCAALRPVAERSGPKILVFGGKSSHASHAIMWHNKQSKWMCHLCLSSAKDNGKRISKGLAQECTGKPPAWLQKTATRLRQDLERRD